MGRAEERKEGKKGCLVGPRGREERAG
jgi:hypothetical protein